MAVGVNIVSTFDSKGISRAIKDFQKIEGSGEKAAFSLKTLDKAVTNGVKNIAKIGAAVGVAAGAIGFKLASAAYESQKVMAQTEAIIKATGGAAGITATQVSKLSNTLSMQIGVDDELIQTSANLLLTFKQIQNQTGENNNVFDRAVIAAQDLGSVFGSADAAALQLGKALSNPEKGITALNRAGINFTEQQKAQIKTLVASGDVLGAQKIILAEVESQVGGTAAAMATGFDRMRIAVGNVAEEFGAILIPYIEKFANYVVQKVVPYLSNLADVIGEKGLGAGLKILADDLLTATTNMGTFGNVVLGLTAAFVALRLIAIAATISVNLFTVSLLSNPIGIVVAAVIALGVALVALYLKFEVVRTVINAIALVLKTAFMNVIEAVYNAFAMLYNGIAQGINLLIKGANLFGANIPEIEMLGYKAFTVIGNAAETAGKKIGASKKSIDTYGSRLDALAASFKGATGGGGGFGGGMAKAVETAQEKLQKYIDALKGMSSAQKAARDADKSLMKSRTSLAEATTKLTDAQAYFNQVVAGYGANSKQAKDRQLALRKAQGAVERAGYDVESSVFAVTKAEQELAAVRLDPESSAQSIREAEIGLAEAKLAVKDATESQVEATDALAEAETLLNEAINGAKEGTDAYTEALDKLNDAKKTQADAEDTVTEAIERQIEAVKRLTEAEEKAREARTGVKAGDATAAETEVGIAPAPKATGGLYGSFMEAVRNLHPNSKALKSTTPVTQAKSDFPKLYAEYKKAGLAMAQGGIITKPTQVLAGESGAEAIIPLDKLQSGMTVNVTINAGMGADASVIGDEIVNVLQRYNRRNGALPLKVA